MMIVIIVWSSRCPMFAEHGEGEDHQVVEGRHSHGCYDDSSNHGPEIRVQGTWK